MHDGDTCEVEVDQGFGGFQRVAVRLFGLSAPEVSGPERGIGLDALRMARELAWKDGAGVDGPPVQLWTSKPSFNRYVGRVLVDGRFDLARAIIALGGARAWDGKTERPAFVEFPVAAHEEELVEYDRLLARDFRP